MLFRSGAGVKRRAGHATDCESGIAQAPADCDCCLTPRSLNPAPMTLTPAQLARLDIREGRHGGVTHGLAPGYVQCNLVIVRRPLAYDFLVYCQRNRKACPVLEVTDPGDPEPRRIAPGADLRTDLPRYAIYRDGVRQADETRISGLWEPDMVAFLIGSGISFDAALERAGVPTHRFRWVVLRDGASAESGD